MPAPWRRTKIDRPVSAARAAGLGAPGQIWYEYDANDWELSNGPGVAAGDAAEERGEADDAGDGAGPDPGEDRAEADGEGPVPPSVPGATPEWRADQP